jgi:hypothetical protein
MLRRNIGSPKRLVETLFRPARALTLGRSVPKIAGLCRLALKARLALRFFYRAGSISDRPQ